MLSIVYTKRNVINIVYQQVMYTIVIIRYLTIRNNNEIRKVSLFLRVK